MAAARVSNTSGVGWNTAVGGGFDTNALSFTVPSGKAAGVVAVVATLAFTGNNGTPAYATPSGWTAIPGATGTVTVGTDVENHQMFYRRLDGTETTVSFTPDRACWKQGWIVLCSGALASGDPTEAAGFTAGATNTTTKAHTVGSASGDGSLAIFSGGNFNNTLVATINNSFTEFFESNNQYCATKAVNTGAVGATTMTLSSGSDAGFAAAVIVKPDTGGATNGTMSAAACAATATSPAATEAAGAVLPGQAATATGTSPTASVGVYATLAAQAATATAASPNGTETAGAVATAAVAAATGTSPNASAAGGSLLSGAVSAATAASPNGVLAAVNAGTILAAVAAATGVSPDATGFTGAVLPGALPAATGTVPDAGIVGAAVLLGALVGGSSRGPDAIALAGVVTLAALAGATARSPTVFVMDVFASGAGELEPPPIAGPTSAVVLVGGQRATLASSGRTGATVA